MSFGAQWRSTSVRRRAWSWNRGVLRDDGSCLLPSRDAQDRPITIHVVKDYDAVMSSDERRLLGCVNVDPPEKQGEDAVVVFCVRVDEEETGLEAGLESAVRRWIAEEWSVRAVRWPGRDISWQEWERLPDA
jgi:hypothetical protein